MQKTVFTRILEGELPCVRLYEDDLVFAIMDAGQVNPGHVLVISRQPYATLMDADEATAARMMTVARRFALAIDRAFAPEGVTLLQTNRPAGWQTVPHIHIHVVPRYTNDGAELVWPRREPGLEELQAWAQRIVLD